MNVVETYKRTTKPTLSFKVSSNGYYSPQTSRCTIEQLLHDLLLLAERELDTGIAEQTGQIVFTELEHQIEVTLELILGFGLGCAYFDEPHDVLVLKHLEYLNLAQRSDRKL